MRCYTQSAKICFVWEGWTALRLYLRFMEKSLDGRGAAQMLFSPLVSSVLLRSVAVFANGRSTPKLNVLKVRQRCNA